MKGRTLRRGVVPWRARVPRGAGAVGRPALPVRRCGWHRVDHDRQREGGGGATGPGTALGGRSGLRSTPEPGSGCWAYGGARPTRWRRSACILRSRGRRASCSWYGVWLFVDWLGVQRCGSWTPGDVAAGGGDGRGRTRGQPTETPTGNSVASSISWDAKVRADGGDADGGNQFSFDPLATSFMRE